MNRADRRRLEKVARKSGGGPVDLSFSAVPDTADPSFLVVDFVLPSGGESLPTMHYDGRGAVDRLRRFCVASVSGALRAAGQAGESERVLALRDELPKRPFEGTGWTYDTNPDGPRSHHRIRLGSTGNEHLGSFTGQKAKEALWTFTETWFSLMYGRTDSVDGSAAVDYPDPVPVAERLRTEALARGDDPAGEVVRVGRWSFFLSIGKETPIRMFSASLTTSASDGADWDFLGKVLALVGVPDPVDEHLLGDTVRTNPMAVHKWVWKKEEGASS